MTDVLAETNKFVLAGRCPDATSPPPTPSDAGKHGETALDVFEWLIKHLSLGRPTEERAAERIARELGARRKVSA